MLHFAPGMLLGAKICYPGINRVRLCLKTQRLLVAWCLNVFFLYTCTCSVTLCMTECAHIQRKLDVPHRRGALHPQVHVAFVVLPKRSSLLPLDRVIDVRGTSAHVGLQVDVLPLRLP